MKINWGTAIVLVFIGFISFILYFVIRMNTEKKYEHDLVTEEYYKKELAFQEEINAEKNARTLTIDVTVTKTNTGMIVSFPKDKDFSKISGSISLYRPSDKKLDFEIPIVLTSSELIIPDTNLVAGRWNITINWSYKNIRYALKKSITY